MNMESEEKDSGGNLGWDQKLFFSVNLLPKKKKEKKESESICNT